MAAATASATAIPAKNRSILLVPGAGGDPRRFIPMTGERNDNPPDAIFLALNYSGGPAERTEYS
jgi:hypothetical protein